MTSKFLLLIGGIALATALASTAHAAVNCGAPGQTIQNAVDSATSGDTIFIFGGTCVGDVLITTDNITLSGNKMGNACNKADPSASADATIDGTVTVSGVRAHIEHLEITGSGAGVIIVNRANGHLICNDISSNQESGVLVLRSSNAILDDNTVSNNGLRELVNPFIFFDVGLFVADASSVRSNGNTYTDNEYAAIEVDRQSTFRNGSFLPRENGHLPIAGETDTIIQKGGDPGTPATCTDFDFGPIAIEAFNNGLVDLRDANVCGEISVSINSSFRIDDPGGDVIGNVSAGRSSWVSIRDRGFTDPGRVVTFTGTLECFAFSGRFGSFSQTVQCGQTCTGAIPGSCLP